MKILIKWIMSLYHIFLHYISYLMKLYPIPVMNIVVKIIWG